MNTIPCCARVLIAMLALFVAQSPTAHGRPPADGASDHGYRIGGTVVDGLDGHALSRARVTISLATDSALARTIITREDGRFFFEHLASGKYVLFGARRGYAPQQYKQHEDFASWIVTGARHDRTNVRFALLPNATISGVVTDDSNEPVRDASVRLLFRGLGEGRRKAVITQQMVTDDEGRYRFGQLHSGTYLIAVEARPWYANSGPSSAKADANSGLDVVYPVTYFSNATDEEGASPISVHAGDSAVADITLHAIPAAHISVQIRNGDHSVTVHSGIWETSYSTTTTRAGGNLGVVEVSGLAPGPVTVEVTSQDGEGTRVRSRSLLLSGNAELDSATISDGAAISGVVKMNDLSALSGPITILLQNSILQQPEAAMVSGNGEFRFAEAGMAAGTYKISVGQPAGATLLSVSATGAIVQGQNLVIGADKEVHLTLMIAAGRTRVGGVALKRGQPLEAAMLLLVPEDYAHLDSLYRRYQSDSDGTFEFEDVVPGRYTVIAIEDGWDLEWSRPEVIAKYLPGGKKIQVARQAIEGLDVEAQ